MKYIIANWKSHKDAQEIQEWLSDLSNSEFRNSNLEVVIAPPFPYLSMLQLANSLNFKLAAQDVSPFPPGSYTGAVNAEQLSDLSVRYAIVGHSERRRYFHESHSDVANKVERCLEASIQPIVCVDDEYITVQAAAIPEKLLSSCMVAYEPLSAIGSGQNEPVEQVKQVYEKITQVFGQVKLIYGGSIAAENVKSYLEIGDGVLVGTASLKSSDFLALLQ